MSEALPLNPQQFFPTAEGVPHLQWLLCTWGRFIFCLPTPCAVPCCNSHPATISSSVTTPSFACCSLNYSHSCLSPCSHHLLKTSLDAAVSPHHPATTFIVSCPASGKNSRWINPNYSVLYLWNLGAQWRQNWSRQLEPTYIHQNTALSNKKPPPWRDMWLIVTLLTTWLTTVSSKKGFHSE